MLRATPLLLLLAAAASQVHLSQALTTFTAKGDYNISDCPINFYGVKYTMVEVKFSTTVVGFSFKNNFRTTSDGLQIDRSKDTDNVKVETETFSGSPPASLPNVVQNGTCRVTIYQYNGTTPLIKIGFESYGSQTVVKYVPFSAFTEAYVVFRVFLYRISTLFERSGPKTANVENFYDISGCRISVSPRHASYGYTKTIPGTCFNRTCNAVSGQVSYVSECGNGEFCNNKCSPVCSVTGPSVVDFHGRVHSIPDHCVYSLVKHLGSSSFEILAGFKERRRLDVPFLDYLKIKLQNPDVAFYLKQGSRVWVNGSRVSLNSTSQVFHGVELSMDQYKVTVKLLFADIMISFDGTTAHVSGMGLAAFYHGLCGNPIEPRQNPALFYLNRTSDNAAGCGIQHDDIPDPNIDCNTVTAHCSLMNDTSFAACHSIVDPDPYITVCIDTMCKYPAVDGLQCQFLESYAEACNLSDVTLGDWRSTTNCPVAPSACLTKYCSTHEFCGKSSAGTGCYCRARFASKYNSTNTLGEPTVCTQDSATLTLAACLLKERNIDYSLLSLNDQSCTGHLDQESHMLEFSFNSTNSCGSEVTTNDGQAIFKNTVSLMNSSVNAIISHQSQVFINFSCLYTAPQPQSASFRIKEGSVVQQIQSGIVNYSLVMNIYDDSALTNVVGPNTEILMNQKIWVELKAEDLDGSLMTLVTDSCWATNQPSPNATLQHPLIINGCPNPDDETVGTQGIGLGLTNVFHFNMFEFTGKSNDVYLHCKLELCNEKTNSCAPSCSPGGKRRRRASRSRTRRAGENPALITIMWSN